VGSRRGWSFLLHKGYVYEVNLLSERFYVGVDLGGTNIKVGICDGQGALRHQFEGPTYSEQGAEAVLARISQYVRETVERAGLHWEQIAGVGAGIAGFLNATEGIVIFSPNLVWHNVPVKQILEEYLAVPVKIDNDANVAALGEAWSGAGHGIANLVCFTLGTGVGGGIIINGEIYQGFSGFAGELGHIKVVDEHEAIQCGCGQYGCVESVSSATGIVHMAKEAVHGGAVTTLSTLAEITAKDVVDAAKAGDLIAMNIVQRAATYLGKALSITAVILNPQRIVIGGGVVKAGDILLDPIRETFIKRTPEASVRGVDIVPATLGNDAGIIGAAGLMLRN
jgi:glucokinase